MIFIGDKISRNAQISVGAAAISKIKEIRADICFLGTNALDVTHGLTDNDWEVVQVKKAMIGAAEKVVSLAISEKLDSSQRIKVCDIGDINVLVTELEPGDRRLTPYKQAGVEVI